MPAAARTVGLLHPGSMGAAVGARLHAAGATVLWCPDGRGPATRARAEAGGLHAVDDLLALVRRSDVLISLVPPAAAEDTARAVAQAGWRGGIYVEANAVAPERTRRIAALLGDGAVVDGAVVGPPPAEGKSTVLCLSGDGTAVAAVAELFAGTDVRIKEVAEEIGAASALKLAYAGFNKAACVLAALSHAVADEHGVQQHLLDLAAPGSHLAAPSHIPTTAAKAWRWGPEMQEIAALLAADSLPDEVFHALDATLGRWDDCKDRTDLTPEQALAALRNA